MRSIKPSYCSRSFRRWDRGKEFVIWVTHNGCEDLDHLRRELMELNATNPNRILGLLIRKDGRRWAACLWATERALAI